MLIGTRTPDKRALYAVSLSGHERVLTSLANDLILHDVASDGRLLVKNFHALQSSVGQRVGDDREREIALHDSSVSDISEDGQLVLFTFPGELLLCKTDGTPASHLGKGEGQGLSADGRWVLAISSGPPRELVLIPAGPGAAKKISIEGVEPQQALLLPNGKGFLVLARGKDETTLHMFFVGPEGGKARLVTARGIRLQSWVASPDGERFAYLASDGRLRIAPVSSGEVKTGSGSYSSRDRLAGPVEPGRPIPVHLQPGGSRPVRSAGRLRPAARRTLRRTLMPADPAGVDSVGGFCLSRDGLSYAYTYIRVLRSDLFVVEGVQ